MESLTKQPADIVDVDIDFARYFRNTNDELTTGVTNVEGNDAALTTGGGGHTSVELIGTPAHTARVWLSGGTDGERYKVEVTLTSTQGRVKEIDFFVNVRD